MANFILTRTRRVVKSFALSAALVFSVNAQAADSPPEMIKSESGIALSDTVDLHMCSQDGVAIGGYDLVSYRQVGGPVAGSAANAVTHEGSTYLFVSKLNKELFVKDPQRYLPAYSGFCAITLALGRVTCPEYTNFKIENDKLLLFEVTGFTNGRTLWNSDSSNFRQQADTNFDRLLSGQ